MRIESESEKIAGCVGTRIKTMPISRDRMGPNCVVRRETFRELNQVLQYMPLVRH